MRSPVYYIKAGVLGTLLCLESFFLTKFLLGYVSTGDYFTPPLQTLGIITGLLLLIIYTYALTIGGWDKWEQYVIVPLPISLGIFSATLVLNPTYAILTGVIAYVLICYDILIATNIKSQMVKFNPRIILRFSTKGLLFLFSLLTAVLVLINSPENRPELSIGSKIGELAQKQAEAIINPQIEKINTETQGALLKNLPIDPELLSGLGGTKQDSSSYVGSFPGIQFDLDLKKTVETEFDRIAAPYKRFIPPLIALIVFALIRFLGGISYLLFSITIGAVFALFKKVGFLHPFTSTVEKQDLSFTQD